MVRCVQVALEKQHGAGRKRDSGQVIDTLQGCGQHAGCVRGVFLLSTFCPLSMAVLPVLAHCLEAFDD
jgi:hypothetical protein